jgi:hypothetical protein
MLIEIMFITYYALKISLKTEFIKLCLAISALI